MNQVLNAFLLRFGADGRWPGEIGHWCPACEMLHPIAVDRLNASGMRWTWNGDMVRPTFSPSIDRRRGPFPATGAIVRCHYFITLGRIEFCSDCTHALAGKVVDLPPLPAHVLPTPSIEGW